MILFIDFSEYLTGFRKRKEERRKIARELTEKRLKDEIKAVKLKVHINLLE